MRLIIANLFIMLYIENVFHFVLHFGTTTAEIQ